MSLHSVLQGDSLHLRVPPGTARVTVTDVPSGRAVHEEDVQGESWTLKVGRDWPSSLYRAGDAYVVVRPIAPTSPIVVSVPFPTWEAYNRPGVPGEGLYQSEQPDRAVKVSLDRPGAGPQIEEWELGLLRWLGPAGYDVDYCSGLDLHRDGLARLGGYRLLVINGHDEYWSWEMRDAAEAFARQGGNIAVFSGNTCWWQVRFEDDARTMVCYRDAAADPVEDRSRTTVEWPSEPVNRPENTLTGVSFRNGAGCWVDSRVMATESYTAHFSDHWVFEGTGLRDGDTFGLGALGYETDAADLEWVAGVPRATGRDGTPPSFVVLAAADLSHWRRYGKGGAATMGIHRLGAGTVFNAATINWGNTLHDPVVARVTRNVLDRLSHAQTPTWDAIGRTPAAPLSGPTGDHGLAPRAMVGCDGRLYAACADGTLRVRDLSGQNLRWRTVDETDAVALASPREAHGGPPAGLYGVAPDGTIRYRDPADTRTGWQDVSRAPEGTIGLAAADEGLFALTEDDLWHLPIRDLPHPAWTRLEGAAIPRATSLTAMNGRLYAIVGDSVLSRPVARDHTPWQEIAPAGGCTVLAASLGHLVGAHPGGRLLRRPLA